MSKYSEALKEFNTTFEPSVDYLKLILEEFNEFFLSIYDKEPLENQLKELCDLLYVICGYAEVNKLGDIDKNNKEIKEMLAAVEKTQEKFPDLDLPFIMLGTAYMEFITSKDFLWLYRLAQGVFTYAHIKHWPIQQAFMRVHKSNMSKRTKDGKVLRNEAGKVLKSDQYKPPNLKDLVEIKAERKAKKSA